MKKMTLGIFWGVVTTCGILFLLSGCSWFKEEQYDDMKIGQVFYSNRDGHYIKLPQNYCLGIDLKTETGLFKISEEDSEKAFSSVYNNPRIISGHYIQGYYNNDYLVLCEESQKNVYRYLSFHFDTQEITEYPDEQKVLETFEFSSDDWRTLCNTYTEMGA